jgi:sortase A
LASAACIALGLLGFAWLFLQWWQARQFHRDADRDLAAARERTIASDSLLGADSSLTAQATAASNWLPANLEIPRLGIASPVLETDDPSSLRRGIGHIGGTAAFGGPGNVGLAGHRDSFFRELRNIVAGDTIRVATAGGDYRYIVGWTRIVDPESVAVLDPTPEPSLTLVTCYPFYYVGPAPRRFVVRSLLDAAQPLP